MEAWLVWLIAGVFAAVGEILTAGFFLAPFGVGAFGAMAVALLGAGELVQFLVFTALTLASFALIRPIAKRHLYQPPQLRTGTAALVGSPAIVIDRVVNDEGVGSVRIGGEVWTARAYDDDLVLEPGAKVQVIEIRGATALVAP
jgi:membrane protein implicated in regulation of membrane protease activity